MDIGRAIHAIRTARGLKLEAIAAEAGTDSGYLSRIENGSRQPSLAMLIAIASAMNVCVSSIVLVAEGRDSENFQGGEGSETASNLDAPAIKARGLFRRIRPEHQTIALEFLKMLGKMER